MTRFLFCITLVLAIPVAAFAQNLDLSGYQKPDGAITTYFQGDKVDPYFATRALLTAQDEGFDIHNQARIWITWAMQQQRPDGLFERYEQNENGVWQAYAGTDADDAMSALWIELLYSQAPRSGMPKAWRESAARAEIQLERLHDQSSGIYFISSSMPVGLLMDNVEIYSSFKRLAAQHKRFGFFKNARVYENKANDLADNIFKTFRPGDTDKFFVSTQARDEDDFYPDKVGQLYPLLFQLPGTENSPIYPQWIADHEQEWFDQRTHDYPWGIVALLSLKMGDDATASCWENRAEPLRYSARWNVLEEVALQSVKAQLTHYNNVPCIGKSL